MSWGYEKNILKILGVLLFGGMCFIFGVALGTSVSSEVFYRTILPVLSAVGAWISGIGSLGAVAVALWLAEKQRRSEKEFLSIDCAFVFVPGVTEAVLMISAVSKGKMPSEINSVSIYGKSAGKIMTITRFLPGSSPLPINLGYGKRAAFLCEEGFEYHIGEYLNKYCSGKSNELEICISTTTENFRFMPNAAMRSALESFATNSDKLLDPNYG